MRQAAETAQPRTFVGEGAPAARPWAAVSRRVVLGGIFLLPLVCWPDLDRPFSMPKLWLLGCLAALAALLSKGLGRVGWQWLVWPAAAAVSALAAPAASFEALLLAALPLPLAFAISRGGVPAERVVRVLLLASAVESAVVILQYCGADPFQLLGWVPEHFSNARMRVYGTLGNPNFAAAWLCGTLPLYAGVLSERHISWRTLHTTDALGGGSAALWSTSLAMQVAAIAATGSRVALIAAPAALIVLAAGRIRAGKWLLAAAVPAAAALLWFSPARPLGETVEGRLYIARTTAAHLTEVPPWGLGPGGFSLKFAQWQAEWLKERGAQDPAKRFAGMLDHAHNEYLEYWVDYGPLGLAAFLCLCGYLAWSARRVWRIPLATDRGPVALTEPRPSGSGRALAWSAAAGAAALLVIALVDFPFHRPAEWSLFWMLMAIPGGASAGLIETVHSVASDQKT